MTFSQFYILSMYYMKIKSLGNFLKIFFDVDHF